MPVSQLVPGRLKGLRPGGGPLGLLCCALAKAQAGLPGPQFTCNLEVRLGKNHLLRLTRVLFYKGFGGTWPRRSARQPLLARGFLLSPRVPAKSEDSYDEK
jgi:hypothetical protein